MFRFWKGLSFVRNDAKFIRSSFTIRVPFLYATTSLNSRNSLHRTSQFTISLKTCFPRIKNSCIYVQVYATFRKKRMYNKQIKKIRSIFKNFKNIWIFPYLHISERPFLSYTFPPLSIIHHRRTVDKETHKNRIVPLYVRLLWKSFLRLSRRGSPRHRENMKNSRREKERESEKAFGSLKICSTATFLSSIIFSLVGLWWTRRGRKEREVVGKSMKMVADRPITAARTSYLRCTVRV